MKQHTSTTTQFTFHNTYAVSSPRAQDLQAVFQCLNERGLTLRDFLEETFKSNDENIKRYVGMFYGKNGPSAIINTWRKHLPASNLPQLTDVALDIVLKEAKTELTELTKNPALRHPAGSISRERIDGFGLKVILRVLKSATCLTRILSEVTSGRQSLVATIGSMLIFNWSQKSSYLQMMMGLYLYSLGCPKRVISLLNDACLSVSHQTICISLKKLTQNALESARTAVKNQHWFLVYDNINFPNRKFHQRVDHTDDFENGTTATIIIGEDLGNEDPVTDQPIRPNLQDFVPDEENRAHIRNCTRFQLLDVLQRADDRYSWYRMPAPVLETLQIRETITFPLPAMNIDQSSVEGNLRIIETVMMDVLDLPKDWFDAKRIIVAGDQLTVSRVRSLLGLLKANNTHFGKMTWAIPVIQLFHLQMILCSTILQTHYGDASTPGSLAFNIALLGRKRIKPEMPCYFTADEFLRNTFEAMVRRLWEVELGTERLDIFARTHAEQSLKDRISKAAEVIHDTYFVDSNKLTDSFGNATANAALFLRDMIVYLELCAAIKSGDIMRIEEALKIITIMFQAGRTKNYGNELLRLTYGFRYVWSPQRKRAIMSSWLVNTSGKKNKWIPTDLYQEHNNLLTKTIHSAKGSNMSWDTLSGSISTNVRMFSRIASKLESQFDIPFNSSSHSVMSAELDIQRIVNSLRTHGILGRGARPEVNRIDLVTDMITEGFYKLSRGRFQEFIRRMDRDQDNTLIENLQEEHDQAEQYINQLFG